MENKPLKNLTVIKIGGSLLEKRHFSLFVRGFVSYLKRQPTVIVHGGGKEVTRDAERQGIKSRFVKGRRFTGDALMKIVQKALSGEVNAEFVSQLNVFGNVFGIDAVGLSGREFVQARRIPSLGNVGWPRGVKISLIHDILSKGRVPVFSSIANDGKGKALNVNADDMAGALAIALRARRLILFTDVPGILDTSGKTIPQVTPQSGRSLIRKKVISGGMIPKIQSSFRALKNGVKEVWILQGQIPLARARGTLISHHSSSRHPFS